MSDGIIVAIITAAGSIVINLITAAGNARKDDLDKLKKTLDEIKKQHISAEEHQKKNNEALKMLLADKLKNLCNSAIKEREVDVDDLKLIEEMYSCYKDLDGNSFVTGLKERVNDLPLKGGEGHKNNRRIN